MWFVKYSGNGAVFADMLITVTLKSLKFIEGMFIQVKIDRSIDLVDDFLVPNLSQ